jgi:hypothetical protein
MTSLRLLAALCATVVWIESCYADCSSLPALAQQHANDMARRNSLDHAGFMQRRGPAGAIAENVAMGCETEACARRMWMQWPPVLGDGDRRQQSCWYPPYWRHSRSSHPQRQRSRWRCRPGFLRRWKQRALIGCPLLALSGHGLGHSANGCSITSLRSLWREGSSQVSSVRLPQSRLTIVKHPSNDAERGIKNRNRREDMWKNAGDH